MQILQPRFSSHIPKDIEDGVLYISIEFKTVVHKCACGCGYKTVTRLSPRDWEITYDGEMVSLYPSIGNWSFPCRSHYWIVKNRIKWAEQWSWKEIQENRKKDKDSLQVNQEFQNVHVSKRRLVEIIKDIFYKLLREVRNLM